VNFNLKVLYFYLIIDAYSKKIIGWYISLDLKAESALKVVEQGTIIAEKHSCPFVDVTLRPWSTILQL
jgi:transposase InsO family protein